MRRLSSAWKPALLCLPAVTLLASFFVAPLLLLGRVSLYKGGGRSGFGLGGFYQPGTWTLSAYTTLLRDSYFWEILGFTVYLGLLVTTLTLFMAYPLALAIGPLGRRAKTLALAAVIRLIDGIRVFDNIYVLVGAGPGGSTTSLPIYIYTSFFRGGSLGPALAASVLFALAAFAGLFLALRAADRRAGA